MIRSSRIYVAGHNGLVGSAIVRRLERQGYESLITRSHAELDLTDQVATSAFFDEQRPEYVFLAAAKVGGILANQTYPADFIRENLLIQTNAIEAAYRSGVRKLVFLGSSCIYPRLAPQPIKEAYLMTGALEPTNEAYAVAKIAGLAMIDAYRKQFGFNGVSLMPTNLYGPGDNFDLDTSHVVPALMRKFHEAKVSEAASVVVWGTGTPMREFLHVDDLADAATFLMDKFDGDGIVNIGVGSEVSIAELAALIAEVVGYQGEIEYDASKPNGTPRKLLDNSRLLSLGWRPRIALKKGLTSTYKWYLEHRS